MDRQSKGKCSTGTKDGHVRRRLLNELGFEFLLEAVDSLLITVAATPRASATRTSLLLSALRACSTIATCDVLQQPGEQGESLRVLLHPRFGFIDCGHYFLGTHEGPVGEQKLRINGAEITSRTHYDVVRAEAQERGGALGEVRDYHRQLSATGLR